MEDEYLDSDMAQRWLRYDAQLRKPWPNFIPPVAWDKGGNYDEITDLSKS